VFGCGWVFEGGDVYSGAGEEMLVLGVETVVPWDGE